MSCIRAKFILFAPLVSLACFGQPASIASPSSPPRPQSHEPAPLPPSPPDLINPDPGSLPKQEDKAKSPAKRAAERLTPLCVDATFRSCLFIGNDNVPQTGDAEREFAKSFEVGDTYFKQGNYKAAESRLREALGYKPNNTGATYKLASSVDKLCKTDEAQTLYQTYPKLSPNGPYADRARKALHKKPATGRY